MRTFGQSTKVSNKRCELGEQEKKSGAGFSKHTTSYGGIFTVSKGDPTMIIFAILKRKNFN